MRSHFRKLAAALALALCSALPAAAQDCPIRIGAILSLTGSLGSVGEAIGEAGKLAVDEVNAAGGVNGCQVEYLLRDDQGQPSVGLDAAKSLVEIDRVSVLLGAIQSGISMPILTSVAIPSGIPQVSCCSTAPSFTTLAAEGGTEGLWFRTIPTVRPQGIIMAEKAREMGYENPAVIYVNSDYGSSLAHAFEEAATAQGLTVSSMVPYQQEQSSYRAEVSTALRGKPDSLFLIAFPADGANALREWLSLGGPQTLMLSNALRAEEFVSAVGPKYLSQAIGIDNSQIEGESVDIFEQAWSTAYGTSPDGPALHNMYDAAMSVMLAMQAGGSVDGQSIAENLRAVTGEGTPVLTGTEGFAQAKELLAAGEKIAYHGATGAFTFDEFGDVAGPYVIYSVKEDGSFGEVDTWDTARVDAAVQAFNDSLK
ncbi:ABC transporter substrate-binding protein [Pseudooceanicola sp. HF7]|uniref:ABC transporter substrate-binding protein n=1 Tax=Pseudooceanicola sp. HF7 TaxID=2721560 RepID=UPI0014316C87|nr:ABC transporter substrate-binding protein [Pseudooceanicola sp. HF7]NIZ10595.1 ABC transporter substrate-binding protein [Pseudooceanicola sp. HF7]